MSILSFGIPIEAVRGSIDPVLGKEGSGLVTPKQNRTVTQCSGCWGRNCSGLFKAGAEVVQAPMRFPGLICVQLELLLHRSQVSFLIPPHTLHLPISGT